MLNPDMRHMLNDLAEDTFGINFESWVTNEYFRGEYIPYSYIENGSMVSNVSVNQMHFMENGVEKNYIQIGTVMTEKTHRGQGLAADLMRQVIREYEKNCDGIYLFGNLHAVGFYQKLGFQKGMQYRYYLKEEMCNRERTVRGFFPVEKRDVSMQKKYEDLVLTGTAFSPFDQLNRFGLQMFYTADRSHVFYAKDLDCFVVMEKEGSTLFLQSVIGEKEIPLKEILKRIHTDYDRLILGFTPHPWDAELFDAKPYDGGSDYRFLYLGDELKKIEENKLYFPEFSHA